MKKASLVKAYNLFWGELQRIYTAAGVTARGELYVDDGESTQRSIVMKSVCYFAGCRFKPSSAKKIDVLLQSTEIYDLNQDEMTKSTVRVLYLSDSDGKAKSLLPLHYDFDPSVKGGHPIFHAQLGDYKFSKNELAKVSFTKVIEPIGSDIFSNVRIPTACMNLASTLLGLTADHFEPAVFDTVLKSLRKSDLIKWNAQCRALTQSMAAVGGHLPSHHWYDA